MQSRSTTKQSGSSAARISSTRPLPANRPRTEMFVIVYRNGAPGTIRTSDPQIRSLSAAFWLQHSGTLTPPQHFLTNTHRVRAVPFVRWTTLLPSRREIVLCAVVHTKLPSMHSKHQTSIGDAGDNV